MLLFSAQRHGNQSPPLTSLITNHTMSQFLIPYIDFSSSQQQQQNPNYDNDSNNQMNNSTTTGDDDVITTPSLGRGRERQHHGDSSDTSTPSNDNTPTTTHSTSFMGPLIGNFPIFTNRVMVGFSQGCGNGDADEGSLESSEEGELQRDSGQRADDEDDAADESSPRSTRRRQDSADAATTTQQHGSTATTTTRQSSSSPEQQQQQHSTSDSEKLNNQSTTTTTATGDKPTSQWARKPAHCTSQQHPINRLKPHSIPSLHVSKSSLPSVYKVQHLASSNSMSHDRDQDVSIQAMKPLHPQSFVAYFEMQIVALPRNAVAAIGLAPANYPHTKQPGWQSHSIGYHSDDGNIFMGSGRATFELGRRFDVGDCVGVGVRWRRTTPKEEDSSSDDATLPEPRLEAFFTRNGEVIMSAIRRDFSNLYPTIGLDRASVEIIFNPDLFQFTSQLEKMEWESLVGAKREVNSIKVEHSLMRKIVRDYLIHEGYVETLEMFDKGFLPGGTPSVSTSKSTPPAPLAEQQDGLAFSQEEKKKLSLRNQISNYICQGQIEKSIQSIQSALPEFFTQFPSTEQILNYQLFIEHLRENHVAEALQLLRGTLSKYNKRGMPGVAFASTNIVFRTVPQGMQDCEHLDEDLLPPMHQIAGLIAYQDPSASPLKVLLHQSRRERVGEVVKRQLKVAMGFSKSEQEDSSVVEQLLSQLLLTFHKAFSCTEENTKAVSSSQRTSGASGSARRRAGISSQERLHGRGISRFLRSYDWQSP